MEEEQLNSLASQMSVCTRCPLYKNRINVVPGEGNPRAKVMFVGEAPGKKKNETGRPFVGSAGKVLDSLFDLIGWERNNIFITSVVKDQPPGNRNPKPDEIKICTQSWLEPQIEIIKPKIIVPLGRYALNYFLPGIGPISQVHGQAIDQSDGRLYFPLYHPASILYRQDLRLTLEEDFKKLAELARDYLSENPE